MIVSLNEVEVTMRKAGGGAGLPPGVAAELGRAAAWLAAAGLSPLDLPLAALRALDIGEASALAEDAGGRPASVCFAGLSALDLLAAGGEDAAAETAPLDVPALMVAYAACASETVGLSCRIRWTHAGEAPVEAWVASGRARGLPEGWAVPRGPAAVALVRTGEAMGGEMRDALGDPAARRAVLDAGVTVSDTLWREAGRLAARILVPATEASRARGAGAGLIDTD